MADSPNPIRDQAVEALVEGKTLPAELLAQLNAEERSEIRTLASTAGLVRSTLQAPDPSSDAQENALLRASVALSSLPAQTRKRRGRSLTSRFRDWLRRKS